MNLLYVVVASLALWRVSSLLQSEAGPFDVFYRFRELIGIHHDDKGDIAEVEDRWLPKLVSCVWCLSMFLALFYIPLWFFFPDIMFWISMPFAVSALAIGLEVNIRG